MKTCLYTACYLDGTDKLGNSRLERNIRYLKYYLNLKEQLGFDKIILCDNASSKENIQILDREMSNPNVVILGYDKHLDGGTFTYDYPYCWRALYTMNHLIDKMGYEKIISIDSDFFVLTSRLAKKIKDVQIGWSSVWCKKYNFPEAAFHILCKDSFKKFHWFTKIHQDFRNGTLMEWSLPFTDIWRTFNCDRFGEDKKPQEKWMDLYGQCPLSTDIHFDMESVDRQDGSSVPCPDHGVLISSRQEGVLIPVATENCTCIDQSQIDLQDVQNLGKDHGRTHLSTLEKNKH